MVSGRGGKKLAPLVGSAALRARVAELEDAEELDSSGSRGSCRFESCLGYASLQRRKFEFLTPVAQLVRRGRVSGCPTEHTSKGLCRFESYRGDPQKSIF